MWFNEINKPTISFSGTYRLTHHTSLIFSSSFNIHTSDEDSYVYHGIIKTLGNGVHFMSTYEGTQYFVLAVVARYYCFGRQRCNLLPFDVQVSACCTHTVPMRLHETQQFINSSPAASAVPRCSLSRRPLERKNTLTWRDV